MSSQTEVVAATTSAESTAAGSSVPREMREYHKSFAASTKDLRMRRARDVEVCAACFRKDGETRRCAKCKHTAYCSTKCQRADWPFHKKSCAADDSSLNMIKVGLTLRSSAFLGMQLESCFALAFDLVKNPQPNQPFVARVDVAVEPAEYEQFVDIFEGRLGGDHMQGMVQLTAFTPLPNSYLRENHMYVWSQYRKSMNEAGLATSPVGILIISKANALVNIQPVVILPRTMEWLRTDPTFIYYAQKGTSTPISIHKCMELMNDHIRADIKNKLSLRTEMTARDVQIIRDASRTDLPMKRPANWAEVPLPPMIGAALMRERIIREVHRRT
ncbi:hypothetical protein B0H19DRAFT_1121873 [Mycena capillaripes]|nr:hypothetical protein B0H19DRAFT_1121873 [Mycena capillaripes]